MGWQLLCRNLMALRYSLISSCLTLDEASAPGSPSIYSSELTRKPGTLNFQFGKGKHCLASLQGCWPCSAGTTQTILLCTATWAAQSFLTWVLWIWSVQTGTYRAEPQGLPLIPCPAVGVGVGQHTDIILSIFLLTCGSVSGKWGWHFGSFQVLLSKQELTKK